MNISMIIHKAAVRTNYNAGRVLREMGLSKSTVKFNLPFMFFSHGPFRLQNATRHCL